MRFLISIMMLWPALLWASVVGAATTAAPPNPVLLLVPLQSADADKPLTYAISLRMQETLEASSALVLHPKHIFAVAETAKRAPASWATSEGAADLAARVGASHYVFGKTTRSKDQLTLTLTVTTPQGTRELTRSLPAAATDAWLAAAPGLVAELFASALDAATLEASKTPAPVAAPAYLQYAQCHYMLSKQSVSLRAPVLLDADARTTAVKHCQDAVKLAPELKQAQAALGFARALLGEKDEAEAALGKSKGDAFHPFYVVGKFWILSRFYDADRAITFLQEATAAKPGFLLGRGYLGESLNGSKRHDEALAVFLSYLEAVPSQPWVMAQVGYTHAKRKEFPQAIEWTKRALDMAPDDNEVRLELGSRFIDAGQLEDARRVLDALARQPDARGEVLLRLGYVHLLSGKLSEAETAFKQALERAQKAREWRTRGRARYDLAKISARRGDKTHTLDELEAAFAEGYKDTSKLSDKDFDLVRNEPRFQALGSRPKLQKIKLPSFASPYAYDPLSGEQQPPPATGPRAAETQKKAVEIRF